MNDLHDLVKKQLEDSKAKNLISLDVSSMSDHFDTIILATGTSSRHVQSISEQLVEFMKKAESSLHMSMEKDAEAEWILIDLGRIVVHVFQEETRKFYNLEKLWASLDKPGKEINIAE
jgi:ribosome-associated protein